MSSKNLAIIIFGNQTKNNSPKPRPPKTLCHVHHPLPIPPPSMLRTKLVPAEWTKSLTKPAHCLPKDNPTHEQTHFSSREMTHIEFRTSAANENPRGKKTIQRSRQEKLGIISSADNALCTSAEIYYPPPESRKVEYMITRAGILITPVQFRAAPRYISNRA